ncbi:MAG: resolvase, partial [Arcobacter sp.]|nr:resolvase [Arcobacter sp.]
MEKLISFIRINKNNEEYTQNQAIGIAQYLHKNNLQLHNNVEIEINIPEDEEKIGMLLE